MEHSVLYHPLIQSEMRQERGKNKKRVSQNTVMITVCCIVIKFEYNKRCSHHIKLAFSPSSHTYYRHCTAQFNGVDTYIYYVETLSELVGVHRPHTPPPSPTFPTLRPFIFRSITTHFWICFHYTIYSAEFKYDLFENGKMVVAFMHTE